MSSTALSIWLVLMGPVLASFLTALADRHCAGGPGLMSRSRCDGCETILGARDLVPILSWPLLGGRCRHCGESIAARLWLAELAGLGLALFAVTRAETEIAAIFGVVFLLLLLGLFQTDRLCFRLPDFLTLPLLCVGAALGMLERGALLTLTAALIGPLALWVLAELYRLRRGRTGLGLGDVKMMAGLSAATGPLLLPWITLIAALLALGLALLRRFGGADVSPTDRIPFGCYLAISGGLVWAFG